MFTLCKYTYIMQKLTYINRIYKLALYKYINKHIYLFLQVNKRQKFINKLFNNNDTLCLLKNILILKIFKIFWAT